MLRGVNKRIIEINDTGSDMFEKALFFIKANEVPDDAKLETEARRIMLSYMTDSRDSKRISLRYKDMRAKRLKITLAVVAAMCLIGVAIALVLL